MVAVCSTSFLLVPITLDARLDVVDTHRRYSHVMRNHPKRTGELLGPALHLHLSVVQRVSLSGNLRTRCSRYNGFDSHVRPPVGMSGPIEILTLFLILTFSNCNF